MNQLKTYSIWMMTSLLLGCTSLEQKVAESGSQPVTSTRMTTRETLKESPVSETQRRLFSETPETPFVDSRTTKPEDHSLLKQLSSEKIGVNFNELPLGQFINEVYGNILDLPFEIDASLSNRQDLVTLRSSEEQSHRELYDMAQQVLMNYGVGIQLLTSHLRFVPAQDASSQEPPLLISGMALPDVPDSHRTVFHFVQLKAVRENTIRNWVASAFEGTALTVESDSVNNALVLKGPASLVRRATETVRILDRPNMRGRYSVRISPNFVDAATLANMLTEVLSSQGIGAVLKPPFGSVIVLPMAPTNSIIAFAADRSMINHIKNWALELDQPVEQGGAGDFFYYQVKNTSARELAESLSGLQSVNGDDGGEGRAVTPQGIFVDRNRNGLIFTGDRDRWQGYLPIIKAMDRPARLVNVEVTVASVTLSNDTDFGVEWLFGDSHGRFTGSGQTNFGLGGNGFSYALNNSGQVRFALNALAQDQRVSILSKPSILVKSGDLATIDVGQEVPVITSQAQSTDAADAPVLQNITYRKTGVLLEVEPIVHSGNRVDLALSQEVSEVLDSVASSVDSPAIFNRRISTSLTLADGGAVILGGLISGSTNKGSNKVPVLGNIPGLGALFRSSGNQESRSELVLVIQAYIIDIEEESWNFNEELERRLDLLDAEHLKLRD